MDVSWSIKKAKHWRIDAFEFWCSRRPLRVSWTAKSNQLFLKEINPVCSLEGLLLKLKLQSFGHLIQRGNSLEKPLMLAKLEGKRRREQQRMGWLDSFINSMDMNLSKLWEIVEDRGAWCVIIHGVAKSQTWLSDWTTTTTTIIDMRCTGKEALGLATGDISRGGTWGHYAKWNELERKRQTLSDHIYTWNLKTKQTHRITGQIDSYKRWRVRDGGKRVQVAKRCKLPVRRWVSPGDVMYSIVDVVQLFSHVRLFATP